MPEWIWWLVIGESTAPATKAVGVLVYAGAMALCLWALKNARREERILWSAVAGGQFLMLGDVRWNWGYSLANLGREAAQAEHWYQQRGAVLPWIVAGTGFLLFVALLLAVIFKKPRNGPARAAVIGTGISVLIHGVQMISWHATDMILYRLIGPIMLVAWLWIVGAGCTCAGAVAAGVFYRPREQ